MRSSFCAWFCAGSLRFLATREMNETLMSKPCQNHKKYLERLKIEWRRLAKNLKKYLKGPKITKDEGKIHASSIKNDLGAPRVPFRRAADFGCPFGRNWLPRGSQKHPFWHQILRKLEK